jgi:hypothetical protein
MTTAGCCERMATERHIPIHKLVVIAAQRRNVRAPRGRRDRDKAVVRSLFAIDDRVRPFQHGRHFIVRLLRRKGEVLDGRMIWNLRIELAHGLCAEVFEASAQACEGEGFARGGREREEPVGDRGAVMRRHQRGDGRNHVGAAERRDEVARIEPSHAVPDQMYARRAAPQALRAPFEELGAQRFGAFANAAERRHCRSENDRAKRPKVGNDTAKVVQRRNDRRNAIDGTERVHKAEVSVTEHERVLWNAVRMWKRRVGRTPASVRQHRSQARRDEVRDHGLDQAEIRLCCSKRVDHEVVHHEKSIVCLHTEFTGGSSHSVVIVGRPAAGRAAGAVPRGCQ